MEKPVEIIKSRQDLLNYRYLKLENGIKCVLIEDSKTEKSCAVMNVSVGAIEDPEEYLGTAHLLEHMLSMGNIFILVRINLSI